MVAMHRASGWRIAVYGREHGVPHFHIEGPGFRCSVAIATGEVIIGVAPRPCCAPPEPGREKIVSLS
jgi:hypothetical protein